MTTKNTAQVGHLILLYVVQNALAINPADRERAIHGFPKVARIECVVEV
jgi:hypothetical protein